MRPGWKEGGKGKRKEGGREGKERKGSLTLKSDMDASLIFSLKTGILFFIISANLNLEKQCIFHKIRLRDNRFTFYLYM